MKHDRTAGIAVITALFLLWLTRAAAGDLTLVATMVVQPDPEGLSRAVFADDAGRQTVATIGAAVAGCELEGVGANDVRLRCVDGAVTVVLW